MADLCTKSEVSSVSRCGDTGFLVPADLGTPGKKAVKRVCVYVSIFYRFRDIAGYLSKVDDFDPPHLHLAP